MVTLETLRTSWPGRYAILCEPPGGLALLLTAIGNAGRGDKQTEIHRLAAGTTDWAYLERLAIRHHVTPLLYLGFNRAAWPLVPAPVQALLKTRFAANLQRNFRLARHAVVVLKSFNVAGIQVMPYKGIFMAQSIYGHLASREVNDIDLLIDARDVERAREVLVQAGFAPTEKLDQEQIFRQQALHLEIDLHWQVSPGFFPVGFDFQALWGRSVTTRLGGVDYREPGREDLLLLLCIQLAKDCWERRQLLIQLQKVCDIAEVIHRTPGLDWRALRGRAAQQGLARVLDFSLALAADLLGAPLPADLCAQIANDRTTLALARQVSALPELAETTLPPERNALLDIRLRLRQLAFYLRLRERQRDKWHYLGRLLRALPAALGRQAA